MKRISLVVLALLASLVLAACGNDDSSTPATSSTAATEDHNDADVTFAQDMIRHHRQALQMADISADRATGSEVKALATRIQAAQQPEIDTMSGWLEAWGEDVPADSDMGMEMGGHGSASMGMTSEEMDELMAASGGEFDRMFLTMMIKHHEGAIEMSKDQQADGRYRPAIDLAGRIINDQQAEIAEMRTLLGQ